MPEKNEKSTREEMIPPFLKKDISLSSYAQRF